MPGETHQINVPPGRYSLLLRGANEDAAATGDLDIAANVTILGAGVPDGHCIGGRGPLLPADLPTPGGCPSLRPAGATGTVIDGRGLDRVFDVLSGEVILRQLAIGGGRAPARTDGRPANGGGIRNSGHLTVWEAAVDHNTADGGGAGIRNTGVGRRRTLNGPVAVTPGRAGG